MLFVVSLGPGQSSSDATDQNHNVSRSGSDETSVSSRSGLRTVVQRSSGNQSDDSEDSSFIINLPTRELQPHQQSNGSNDSQTSRQSRASNDSQSRKRSTESFGDSLPIWLPDSPSQPAKKKKSNEQSNGNRSRSDSQNASYDGNDDDELLVPSRSNAQQSSGMSQGKKKKTAGRTGAPEGGPSDDDGDSSGSSSNNSISVGRHPNLSQSSRRSNSSQSSNNRSHDVQRVPGDHISGAAPQQKVYRERDSAPTKAYTAEEQKKMRDKDHRNKVGGKYKRFEGA